MRINKGVIVAMNLDQPTTDLSWWVVQTKPQGEALAIEHLHEQKLTTYCPMYQKNVTYLSIILCMKAIGWILCI